MSWTPPSGKPAVTGYIIYYQQDGGQRLSQSAGPTATTVTITGLVAGATYSITMVATSSTLPSNKTETVTVNIGTYYSVCFSYILIIPHLLILYGASSHLLHLLSLLYYHGWRHCHCHLLYHFAYWSNWYSKLSVGGAWSNFDPS